MTYKKVLSFDISTKAGWAFAYVHNSDNIVIKAKGNLVLDGPVISFGEYPFCYLNAAENLVNKMIQIVEQYQPDQLVIEEVNLGKSRYSQKILEWIHCLFVQKMKDRVIVYLDSSSWRTALSLRMSKDQKKNNAQLSKIKRENGGKITFAQKKELGVAGKITKKHLAIEYVNRRFNWGLKQKDNDVADAVCLVCAWAAGAVPCDGVMK